MPDFFGNSLPENPECLDDGDGKCAGAVQYRESLSGTGTPIPRCGHHWTERLKLQRELRQRYPRQAPADFDPAYAGERWGEDD